MNVTLFFIVICLLQGLSFILTKLTAKKTSSSLDYFLAGRNITVFPLTMTLIATLLGGGLVLGSADESFVYGWSFFFYPLGIFLGLLLLGLGFGRKLHEFRTTTVAQIVEIVYHSPFLKHAASLFSVFSLFFILIAQILASKKFLEAFGFESSIIFMGIWGIVFFYVILGGLKGIIKAHIVQTLFFSTVLCFAILFVFLTNPENFHLSLNIQALSTTALPTSQLLGWLVIPIFFLVISQDMAQRCFAAKSNRIIFWGCLLAGLLLMVLSCIPIFFGVAAKNLGIIPKEGGSILMSALENMTNPIITALVGGGLISAIVSSAASLINAISSNLSTDFTFKARFSLLKSNRAISFLVSFSSLFLAFIFYNVFELIVLGYEILISTLFIPILAGFFKKKGNFRSALYAMIAGGLALVYFKNSPPFQYIPYQLLSVFLSLLGFLAGEIQEKFIHAHRK